MFLEIVVVITFWTEDALVFRWVWKGFWAAGRVLYPDSIGDYPNGLTL